MKTVRNSSPDETVLSWLAAELKSKRFQDDLLQSLDKYELSTQIIASPNLDDISENNSRLKVLRDYRDWFKDDVYAYQWKLVELTPKEVKELRYIDYSYWNELSDNTHLVGVAAKNVRRGKVVFDVSNDNFFNMAGAVEAGAQFPPIIALEREKGLEIVEGHARATGYSLVSSPRKPLLALVGTQKIMRQAPEQKKKNQPFPIPKKKSGGGKFKKHKGWFFLAGRTRGPRPRRGLR